jgi:RecA-family ATPase
MTGPSYPTARDPLIANGYLPLPLRPRSKVPAVGGWHTAGYVPPPPARYGGFGVGLACGPGDYPLCAIDIDVTDARLSGDIASFAKGVIGYPLERVGQAPKRLLLCRHKGAAAYRASKKYACGRIEILEGGRQFAAFGTHEKTGKDYEWIGDSPLERKACLLPVISGEQIQEIIARFEELAAARGFELAGNGKAAKREYDGPDSYDPGDPLDVKPPIGMELGEAAGILAGLDPDCGREQWINLGMALHNEFSGSLEAMELWAEWSAKGSKYKDGEPENMWRSFGRYSGRPLTGAYLLAQRKREPAADGAPDGAGFFQSLDWSTGRFAAEPPDLPMVIDGFLPRGVVAMMYSAGGVGKSMLTLSMAVKIALAKKHGADFLGRNIPGGRVAVLTSEDPDKILHRRFIGTADSAAEELGITRGEALADLEGNLLIGSTFGHSVQFFKIKYDGALETTEYYESFLERLREVDDLQLVIVDTMTRYSPAEGKGNATATQEITHYERIAKATGASVLLLHHTNKPSRDGSLSGSQAYRDATALFDCARACWYLRGCRPDELAANGLADGAPNKFLIFENAKNNYLPMCPAVILERDGYKFTSRPIVAKAKMSKAERDELKRQEAYDKTAEILQRAGGPLTQTAVIALCRAEGVGNTMARYALCEMANDGLLEKYQDCRKNCYRLTDEGRLYGLAAEGADSG